MAENYIPKHANLAYRYSSLFLLACKETGLAGENKQLFDFMYSVEENTYKQVQYETQSDPLYHLFCFLKGKGKLLR